MAREVSVILLQAVVTLGGAAVIYGFVSLLVWLKNRGKPKKFKNRRQRRIERSQTRRNRKI